MDYIPKLLSALRTIQLALAFHPHKNKDGVVRKTARRLLAKQEATGEEYLRLLISAKEPYNHFKKLENKLFTN